MTARGTWKRRERDVAKALGGERKPVSGRVQHEPDVTCPLFVCQVKHGRRRPVYLAQWLDGIRRHASSAQTGIVIWCDNREDLGDAVVLINMKDFIELHGKVE